MKIKNISEAILILITFLTFSCQTVKEKITIKQILVKEEIKLPLPKGNVLSVNQIQIIKENGKTLLFVYFFPQNKIFVYDLKKRTLIHQIPIYRNLSEINNFRYINNDSIWVFGSHSLRYNYDSSLMVVNYYGVIKHIYPFYNNFFVSLKTYPKLYCDSVNAIDKAAIDTVLFTINDGCPENLIVDKKVFFTTIAGNIGRKSHLPQLPIVGYYDLEKKEVKLNDQIYYPYFSDSLFYPNGNLYYYPVYWSVSPQNKILLSFCYTPTIFEWDYINNNLKTHRVKTQLIDTIYPLLKPTESDNDTTAIYYHLFYAKNLKMYLRFAMLSNNYGNKRIVIFSDKNFNYLGEAIIELNEMPRYVFEDNFVSTSISGDSLTLKFFKYEFKHLDINTIKKQLDSTYIALRERKEKEMCKITGNDEDISYSSKRFLHYLKDFEIIDSSFAVIVLSKNGCHSCNEYISKTIAMNQQVFFNLKKKPFYLLYVDEDDLIQTAKHILNEYEINENSHLKIDTTKIYKNYNPFNNENPRLVLVENNQIISDTVYMPDNLETLVERLLKFYGLETQ